MKLRYLACLALVTGSGVAAQEISDELALKDPTIYISDPEFDYVSNTRMLWHGVDGRLWLATVDPGSGSIVPDDGRGLLLDEDVAVPQLYGNGAEWVYGADGTYIVYNNLNQEIVALREEGDQWQPVDLGETQNSFVPIGTPPGSQVARISFYHGSPGEAGLQLHSRALLGSQSPLILPDARNSRWLDGDHFVTAVPVRGVMQAALVDFNSGEVTVLTDNPGVKNFSRIMYAPDLGVDVLFCATDWRALEMWVPDGAQWTLLKSIEAPDPDRRMMRDPEPFVYKGKSYVAFVCSRTRAFEAGNSSDVWLAPVNPNIHFVRRLNRENLEGRFLIDAEYYVAEDDAYIFYGELSLNPLFPNGWYTTRKAGTGLDEVVPVAPGRGLSSDGGLVAWPLPFSGGELNVSFATSHDGALVHTEVAVYDVAGRRIKLLAKGVFPAGPRQLQWDGRDERGNLLPSGVYFLRASTRVRERALKVVIVR